jgi:hypothetical protein
MSVTFWCPEAPTKTIACEWCVRYAAEEPKMLHSNGRCDPTCPGVEEVSEAPECNFGNSTALAVTNLLGLDQWGGLELDEMPAVMQRIMVATNSDSARNHLVTEGSDTQETRMTEVDGMPTIKTGPRVITFGNTDESTQRRLQGIQKLLTWAMKNGHPVTWG